MRNQGDWCGFCHALIREVSMVLHVARNHPTTYPPPPPPAG
jgi:hypothetical protein